VRFSLPASELLLQNHPSFIIIFGFYGTAYNLSNWNSVNKNGIMYAVSILYVWGEFVTLFNSALTSDRCKENVFYEGILGNADYQNGFRCGQISVVTGNRYNLAWEMCKETCNNVESTTIVGRGRRVVTRCPIALCSRRPSLKRVLLACHCFVFVRIRSLWRCITRMSVIVKLKLMLGWWVSGKSERIWTETVVA
jgi:hypothetical protein